MNPVLVTKLSRHALQFVAGVLIARGFLDQGVADQFLPHVETAVGGILSLISLYFMVRREKKKETK